jgi:predicted ester cyclase
MQRIEYQFEQNKTVVRQLFNAWSAGDLEAASGLISPECNGGGVEGFRRELQTFLLAFPDLQITLEDLLAENDRVATRVTMYGTHRGALFGVPATNKNAVMKANHIFRLEGGLIVQRYGQMDRLELMQQLGMKLVSGASV